MKKLKIKNILIALFILTICIIGSIKYLNYRNSNYYKLKEIGYSKEDIKIIEGELKSDEIISILDMDYSANLTTFIKEKYFIFDKLKDYIEYYNDNKNKPITEIVTTINTHTNKPFYKDVKTSDISKGILTLVNKYYMLNKDYSPQNIVNMSLQYSYEGNKIIKDVHDKYVDMCKAAKTEKGFTLIATSSYRDYTHQETLYERYKAQRGQKYADSIAARPGHSEHQVGLALDIVSYGKSMGDFGETEEFLWLKDNAYKFGFILRYPEDKEHITGYDYEPWHYRYVGNDVAKYIYENNITFDEYYAFFVEKK